MSIDMIATGDGTKDGGVPQGAPSAEDPVPPSAVPFGFDEARKFDLYMEQRRTYAHGARSAYQWFDQTIIALSAGAIALSIGYVSDRGVIPETILWLKMSWISFVLAAGCSFASLVTGGEVDYEGVKQIDCLVMTGECDESKAKLWGRLTKYLNWAAAGLAAFGVFFLLCFAIRNVEELGRTWQQEEAQIVSSRVDRNPPPSPEPQNHQGARP